MQRLSQPRIIAVVLLTVYTYGGEGDGVSRSFLGGSVSGFFSASVLADFFLVFLLKYLDSLLWVRFVAASASCLLIMAICLVRQSQSSRVAGCLFIRSVIGWASRSRSAASMLGASAYRAVMSPKRQALRMAWFSALVLP
jgi:hypothetical protein